MVWPIIILLALWSAPDKVDQILLVACGLGAGAMVAGDRTEASNSKTPT